MIESIASSVRLAANSPARAQIASITSPTDEDRNEESNMRRHGILSDWRAHKL
jgi:hypothetical protein